MENNRRRSAYDLGGKYNAAIVAIVKSGFGKWQPAKVSRKHDYNIRSSRLQFMTLIVEHSKFDLCSWGMCVYDIYLQSNIYYYGGSKAKNLHWNYICKLRRLRKPWEAIKTKV